jgi:hypothetical protein
MGEALKAFSLKDFGNHSTAYKTSAEPQSYLSPNVHENVTARNLTQKFKNRTLNPDVLESMNN